MNRKRILENIEASLLKCCKDLNVLHDLDCEIFNFDTHATINELPNSDLIGIMELDITNMGGTLEGGCMFTVCTTNDDTDLARLRKAISCVFDKIQPGVQLDNVTAESGSPIGKLTIMDPVRLIKVGSTKGRPIQMVACSFGSGLSS